MREGELFGLHWEDVDLKKAVVRVRRALRDVNGHPEIAEPKTRASRRQIALNPRAVRALRAHRKRVEAAGDVSALVFTGPDGGLIRRSNFLRREFQPLLERAKVPRIRFHDLRHTTATLLLRDGAHPKVVQEILGHERIGTTLDTYSHTVPTMQREALNRLKA